ncbi:MAG: redoxin domain-containing protein [Sphingobacteriales bacterium]|nr:redoxin domain-containing protein [Sphingobacteriales bacterium]
MRKLVVLAFLSGLFLFVVKAQQRDSLKLGQAIIPFNKLNNAVKGQPKSVSLDSYNQKKGMIIVFMTNSCSHCIRYRDRIKALQTAFAHQGYPLITINPSNPNVSPKETLAEMQKNAIQEKYDFPYLQDPDQVVAYRFKVRYTPEAYILKREKGQWILKYYGPLDDDMENKKAHRTDYVINVMQALIHHQKVPEYDVVK